MDISLKILLLPISKDYKKQLFFIIRNAKIKKKLENQPKPKNKTEEKITNQ
jgi:hypothetical protein